VCFVNVESVDRIIYSIFQRFNLEWKTRTLNLFTQAAWRHPLILLSWHSTAAGVIKGSTLLLVLFASSIGKPVRIRHGRATVIVENWPVRHWRKLGRRSVRRSESQETCQKRD